MLIIKRPSSNYSNRTTFCISPAELSSMLNRFETSNIEIHYDDRLVSIYEDQYHNLKLMPKRSFFSGEVYYVADYQNCAYSEFTK